MTDFLFSFNAVAPLFVLMIAGYLARNIHFISDTFLSETNKFVFRFLLPIMLFRNIQSNAETSLTNPSLIYTAVAGILLLIAVCFWVVPLLVKKRGQQGSIVQALYRSNFIIYGLPLATSMYGEAAFAPITTLLVIIIPLYNIMAVLILSFFSETRQEKITLKSTLLDILKNPLILGAFAGFLFGALPFGLPVFIDKPLSELANMAAPLALFVMGGEFKFSRLSNNLWQIVSTTAVRLLLIPTLFLAVFVWMGFREIELATLICVFATPTAVVSFIMSENMGCDGELSAQIVVSTTLFSGVSIFLFIYVLRTLGYL